MRKFIIALGFLAFSVSSALAFDMSFSGQDFTDQGNGQDNVCFVNNQPC